MTKFCKDCEHCERATDLQYAHCLHPESAQTDNKEYLVSGVVPPRSFHYCSTMRGEYGSVGLSCGAEARLFQPKGVDDGGISQSEG